MSIIKDFEYVVAMGVLGLKAAYTRKKIARKAKTFGAEGFEGLMVDFGEHCLARRVDMRRGTGPFDGDSERETLCRNEKTALLFIKVDEAATSESDSMRKGLAKAIRSNCEPWVLEPRLTLIRQGLWSIETIMEANPEDAKAKRMEKEWCSDIGAAWLQTWSSFWKKEKDVKNQTDLARMLDRFFLQYGHRDGAHHRAALCMKSLDGQDMGCIEQAHEHLRKNSFHASFMDTVAPQIEARVLEFSAKSNAGHAPSKSARI